VKDGREENILKSTTTVYGESRLDITDENCDRGTCVGASRVTVCVGNQHDGSKGTKKKAETGQIKLISPEGRRTPENTSRGTTAEICKRGRPVAIKTEGLGREEKSETL